MEYNNLPAKRLNEHGGEDKPQIFRTLRNIDLNLLTILRQYMSIRVSLTLRKFLISRHQQLASPSKSYALYFLTRYLSVRAGVTPTAYATHLHEYISRGWSRFWAHWI